MIVPNHHENPQVLNENVLPRRAYYIPASTPLGPLVADRERSDSCLLYTSPSPRDS